mmetsp:Transcript_553/g.730  ORF Transcript_553/g.730 Transcript_553/m.730 type:complete len:177 (-) Transcript_553:29-559(-)
MSEPVNCFLLFCQEERETISQHCTTWDNAQVTSHLGALWREMDPMLKLQYKNRAATAKKNFAIKNPNFKRKAKVESRYISSFRLSGPCKKISKPAKPQRPSPLQYFDVPAYVHYPTDLYYPPVIYNPRPTGPVPMQNVCRSISFPMDTLDCYSHGYPYSTSYPCDLFNNPDVNFLL